MANSKFKTGQVISFVASPRIGKSMRKGGIITKVEKMYELKDKYQRTYPDGSSCGQLTTIKELSNGKAKGYAYRVKTIQPKGFTAEIVSIEEYRVKLSNKQEVIESYTDVTGKKYTK